MLGRFAGALFIVSISSLFAFGLGELVLRHFYKYPQPQFLMLNPRVGHRHRPMSEGYFTREGVAYVRINRHGFRDSEYSVRKTDKKRIAIVGDSYTEAFQVNIEASFHGLLETEFKQTLEVLNFGVSGYGTAQQLLAYRFFVRPFHPDVVILAFNPGNDLADNDKELSGNYPRPYFTLIPGAAEPEMELDDSFRSSPRHQRADWIYDLYYFLTDHSLVFSLLDQLRYRKRFNTRPEHWPEKKPAPGSTPVNTRLSQYDERKAAQSHLIYHPVSRKHLDTWLLTEHLILTLAGEVEEDGAEFVLFVLDSMPLQLSTPHDPFYVEHRLNKQCIQHHWICRFMAPEAVDMVRGTGAPLHGFHGYDSGHWNQSGHQKAYQILRHTLLNEKLVP